MNWKAMFVGGLTGFFLSIYMYLGLDFGEEILGIHIQDGMGFFTAFISLFCVFIAGLIAGAMSPKDAWKNGIGASVIMTILIQSANYFTGVYSELGDAFSELSFSLTGLLIIMLILGIIYALAGMIGGFTGKRLWGSKELKDTDFLNGYLCVALTIYMAFNFFAMALFFEWLLICGIFYAISGVSLLGFVVISIGKPKLGAYLFSIGSIGFIPIGFIGIIGTRKILDQLEEEDFKKRKELSYERT